MEKKNLVILIIILVLFIVGLGGYFIYDNFIKNNDLKSGTFTYDGYDVNSAYGTVQVEGYVTVELKEECESYNFEDDLCETDVTKYNYVIFNIERVENEDFKDYIQDMVEFGNNFVSENAIGLGCIADDILSYYNYSDDSSDEEYKLSKSDTAKIINATKGNPIILELERLKLSAGSGAPNCYSHITKISFPD